MTDKATINGKTWTKKDIQDLIENSSAAATRALMVLYDRQTADEQDAGETTHDNARGFNGLDAEILSSFAKQYQAKGWLSAKQMALAKKKLKKYAGQLLDVAAEKAMAEAAAGPVEPPIERLDPAVHARIKAALWPPEDDAE